MRPTLSSGIVTMGSGVPRYEEVPLHRLSLPDNHCGMDLAQVQLYVKLIRAGHSLRPVLLYEDGERCWVVDGRHRFLATAIAGKNTIGAFVSDTLVVV